MKLYKILPAFSLALGISGLVMSSAIATPPVTILAQDYGEFPNYCEESESVFIAAETENYIVNICGGDNPYTYVGVSKIDGDGIRLPLSDYDPQGNYFEATNGDVSYLLIRGSAKGDFLTVTQGDEELFREPVLDWFE
jgi:hypothetical protein